MSRCPCSGSRRCTFRRLNRTEYQNAIRDLLALDVDVTALLPRDDASYGFDNVGAVNLSPALLERYLSAAGKVSRLAVGSDVPAPGSRVVVLPADLTQEDHFDGLPFGTRGGTAVTHNFPADGEYEIQVRLSRNRNENVEGLYDPHDLEITLDGERLQLFEIRPNRMVVAGYYADADIDKHLQVRVTVGAGPHRVGAAFLKKSSALIETERQPYDAHFNMDRHPCTQPGVRSVAIAGPFATAGVGDTPSRRRIFVCRPASAADEPACARTIIGTLARRAYRRPVGGADLAGPLAFYARGRERGGFLDTVREVERRIQRAEQHAAASPLPAVERPTSVPDSWEEHVKLMFDLQVLALQTDLTRVITFQLAREASTRTYPQIGVAEPHHPVSHHVNDPEKLTKLAKINAYHVSLFAYLLGRLRATEDGDGSLLDHTTYLYGSGMGNPNVHDHSNLPIVVARGGAGDARGGWHLRYAEPTPLANLHLTLLDYMGVHLDNFVDSTGRAGAVLEPLTL